MSSLKGSFLLDPEVAFLNHGSFGACPEPVLNTYRAWQNQLEREPVDFMVRRAPGLLAEARQALADHLGVGRDDLVYVTNATTGVNIVARSLPLGPSDTVVATDHEYGACDRTWRFVCRRRGARYQHAAVKTPIEDPAEIVAAVAGALDRTTKVVFVSHITSPTAMVFPVAEIVALAREHGALTVVDGAHAPGQVPVDLAAIGADFYAGNCHKWLCAPKGAGFLYARPAVQDLLEPLIVSWGWESETPGPSRFVDEHELTGTRDLAAFLSVPAALAFQAENHWDDVRTQCHELLRHARSELLALPGIEALHPDDPAFYRQMVAVKLPPCDPILVSELLYRDHKVEVPGIDWNGQPLLRVSIQGYNSVDDVGRLIAALPQVVEQARRQ